MKNKSSKIHRLAAVAALIGAPFYISPTQAADVSNENVEKLLRRIDELEQKVKALERNQEIDKEVAAEKAKKNPTVELGSKGLIVRSADSNFVMNVHGYVQTDGRFYLDDSPTGRDTFLMRRVRPIIEGTVYEKFDYRVMLDFGSGITSSSSNDGFLQDGYVNARLWEQFQLQIGKQKQPIGLERLKSASNLVFVERGFPTLLVPNRDVGITLHNDLFNSPVNYSVGIFNGLPDGATNGDFETADKDKDFVGRLYFQPFLKTDIEAARGLGFGVAGSIGHRGGTPGTYKTPGQQTFFSYLAGSGTAASPLVSGDGTQSRISPQGYYYWGPFGLLAEYVVSSQELKRVAGATTTRRTVHNSAWVIEVSYFLTGEDNSYGAISPLHPFSIGNGWGAWEIAARVQQLTVDDDVFQGASFATADSANKATSWGVGVNWYLNKNIKLNADYEHTRFDGGSPAPTSVTSKSEHVILSRVQFAF